MMRLISSSDLSKFVTGAGLPQIVEPQVEVW